MAKAIFTSSQINAIKKVVREVLAEETAKGIVDTKKSTSKATKKKDVPAFSKLEIKKSGRSYIVVPTGKLGKAYRFYAEDAKNCGGEYVKYDADTEKGGWWKFKSEKDAQKFFDTRKADYDKWAKTK